MAKRIWVAKMNCQMPFRDFMKGEEIELDDENVTARVKALFDCRDKEEKAKADDADFKVMVARLKAAKIPIPRGANKDKVKELFKQFLVDGATAPSISGEVTEDTEDKANEDKSGTEEVTDKDGNDGK